MRYEGQLYRPPSEAYSYILQATIGCSHNLCLYCDMYRAKRFRVRPLQESLEDLQMASAEFGHDVEKLFVADGDALILDMEYWEALLDSSRKLFPRLRRVSCYATAMNILEKSQQELETLASKGLTMLYIGPESGDDETLRRLVKGAGFDEHVEAAKKAHAAGMKLSVIVLLGAGGIARSQEHAEATARLLTEMDPEYAAALTLTVLPSTPLYRAQQKEKFTLPSQHRMFEELRTIIELARPTKAVFRSNHASNYLPLQGTLPQDREVLLEVLDAALNGKVRLRPEWARGL
jgi:radical SAM superfamily enzyme YgiQ (UPF0313 family)